MHGPLSEIGLIEVLQLLERGRRSGKLRLSGSDPAIGHVIRIAAGRVVAIEPDADAAAVRRALIRRCEIDPSEPNLDSVAAERRESIRHELARAALQTMLHWSRGRFDFQASDGEAGPLDWSVDSLVLELVAAESERADLATEFAGWRAVPRLASATILATGGRIALDPLEWRLIEAADGSRDVAALAAHLGESLEEIGIRLRSLVVAAIIQLEAPSAVAAAEPLATIETAKYDEAVAQLRARTEARPDDGEAWRTLGLTEVGAGRFDRAIAAWSSWQQAVPGQADDATALIRAARTMMEALSESSD